MPDPGPMPDLALGGVVAGATTWLLTYLLHSSVVVCAVWALVRTGWVRRPTTQDLLWKVALTGALVTASVALISSPGTPPRTFDVEVRRSASEGAFSLRSGPSAGDGVVRVRALATDPSPACREALRRVRGDPGADPRALRRACVPSGARGWRGLLLATWLLIGSGFLLGMLRGHAELRRSVRGAVPAPPGLGATVRDLLAPSRLSAAVVVARDAETPCVVAGRVVLPARCVESLAPDEIRAVLAHEVAHVVRRDPAWIALGEVLCRMFWMQPLTRVALAGLRGSAELVCDDWAVERTRRPLDLARSIARVAHWLQAGQGRPVWGQVARLTHLAPGQGHTLSARVRRILNEGASRRAAPRPVRMLLAALVLAPTLAVPAVPRGTPSFAVFVRREVVEGAPLQAPGPRREDVVILVRGAPDAES